MSLALKKRGGFLIDLQIDKVVEYVVLYRGRAIVPIEERLMSLIAKLSFMVLFLVLAMLAGIGASGYLQFLKGPPMPSVAEVTLAEVWAEKLGDLCLGPEKNNIRWCSAYVKIVDGDTPINSATGSAKGTRVIRVRAIHSDGELWVEWSRSANAMGRVVDPKSILQGSDPDQRLLEKEFLSQNK